MKVKKPRLFTITVILTRASADPPRSTTGPTSISLAFLVLPCVPYISPRYISRRTAPYLLPIGHHQTYLVAPTLCAHTLGGIKYVCRHICRLDLCYFQLIRAFP